MKIPEKNAQLTDTQTHRQTERQADNIDFIGPSAGQESKYIQF